MTTLAELLTEVYTITRRPDLVTLTTSAVKRATLKAHRQDFYSKDLYETGLDFGTAAYIQSWNYAGLISNWRKLSYFKRVESASDTEGCPLEIITPEEVLDSYRVSRTDIAYVAGNVLEIRAAAEFRYALVGVYVAPVVTDLGFSSWIADLNSDPIVYEAARQVSISIGNIEEANHFRDLASEARQQIAIDATTDINSR